ncbi:hypothetical protein [Longimicrobium sp.]|uniref:hypothetical protein n=1 Tax=Longimicrobium sp. TaxID=2029185 RepID=UPI002E334250|nr:hypothetical protein [Longimicrobium sp.]HEX6042830.1 hypothetical protein [Longimicrobium sp.]
MSTHPTFRAAVPSLLIALAACGGEGGAASAIRVDTLPNGAVAVHNPEQGLWTEKNAWRAVEDLRLGQTDGTGPDVFGNPTALEVDAYGRLYVMDPQTKEVRVFGADGTHVRTLGRKGGGPGELEQPIGLTMGPQGALWVVDAGNARYTVWDTAGTLRTTVPRRGGHVQPWPGRFDRQGRLWDLGIGALPQGGAPELLRVDPVSGRTESMPLPTFRSETFQLTQGNSRMSMSVPFTPSLSWALDADGRVWSGVSDRYRLVLHEPGGDTLRVVERASAPVPVTGAEMDSIPVLYKWFTDQGGKLDLSRVPDHKPLFETFHVDDQGWLWVRPSMPADAEQGGLDVFDPEGHYQGRLALPREVAGSMGLRIRGNYLYAIVQNEDGIPQIVRMRIEGRPPRA